MRDLIDRLGEQTDFSPSDVEDLRTAIRHLDRRYYIDSEQDVPDAEYDRLFGALQDLEEEHPALRTPDSPTQRVAYGLSEEFPTVAHTVPMLSLDNSYDDRDLNRFDEQVRRLSGSETIRYTAEPKFDGASIALLYKNDTLVRAATRGDGVHGDDITANATVIRTIPLHAEFSRLGIHRAEVRGEVVIDLATFQAINERRLAEGLDPFKNARNTASGGLRMKDSRNVSERGLEAVVYQLAHAVDSDGRDVLERVFSNHHETLDALDDIGFRSSRRDMTLCDDIEAVHAACSRWETRRADYRYEIDGVVVKADSFTVQRDAGQTAHHPRWAMAYKFKAQQAVSPLLRVDYQVGRTGAVTPVAKIEPVHLAGVTVSSISLHNADFISDKDIRLGDHLVVERAGDVIPYVVRVDLTRRDDDVEPIDFPTRCPACESPLERPADEAVWRCVNAECPAQAEERLIHFVSKQAMDIDGLGRDIIKRFRAEGLLSDIEHLYSIDLDAILALDGWKERSVDNLRAGIEASKERPLWRLIVGLGIRHVGSQTAKMLERQVDHLRDFIEWDAARFAALDDVGPTVAESLVEFFRNDANRRLIDALDAAGLNLQGPERPEGDQPLAGRSFVFTGSLTRFTRDEAKQRVEALGARTLSGVSKKLDYLVAGEKAGSKLTKAQGIETITILSEDDFLALLDELERA